MKTCLFVAAVSVAALSLGACACPKGNTAQAHGDGAAATACPMCAKGLAIVKPGSRAS